MSIVNEKNRMELLANSNVKSLTFKSIAYTDEFILKAIEAADQGISGPSIWSSANFDLSYFKEGYFRKCINRWRTQVIDGQIIHQKKGFQADIFQSKDEELEFVKAENLILKELRALGISAKVLDSGLSLELFRKIKTTHSPASVNWQTLAKVVFTNGSIEK